MKIFPLRIIGTYLTDKPVELSRQLSQLEQNVDDAVKSVQRGTQPVFQPTNRKTATYTAAVGELVRVDTSASDVSVVLPVATPQNAGLTIAVARMSAANALTVGSASGLVNGTASLTLTAAVRLFLLVSDGVGWWSTA